MLSFPFRLSPWLVAGAWAITIGLPFQLTAYANPVQLPLPRCSDPNFCDYKEYISWITSGNGIREATDYLQATIKKPETIIGSAVDCNAARLAVPYDSPLTFKCYDLDWGTPENNRHVVNDMEEQIKLKGHVYVLGENILIVPESMLPIPWCVVKVFPRPDPYVSVKLYYIGPGANEDQCLPEN